MRFPKTFKKPDMGGVLNMLIPPNVKEEFAAIFIDLTSGLTEDKIHQLIDMNISLWRDLLNDELRAQLFQKGDPMGQVLSENLIYDWIIDAKPEFARTFESPKARLWLLAQINEIRDAICRSS